MAMGLGFKGKQQPDCTARDDGQWYRNGANW